jgi:UDP-glucose 4-epimerase
LADFQPEIINHHAAQISVVVSVDEPEVDAARNIVGTIVVVQAAKATASVKKIIYASSGGAMYGNAESVPTEEGAGGNPISPYGLSKYVAERYIWLLTSFGELEATVLRYSNVYGPRQDPHGEAGVCAIFAGRMLQSEPVTIFGDGSQVRDYVFVGDVAAANLTVLEQGSGESFNISTGVGTSTREVFDAVKAETGYALEPIMGPERDGEVQKGILSPAKALKELDWKAGHTFVDGTAKTIEWYRNNS